MLTRIKKLVDSVSRTLEFYNKAYQNNNKITLESMINVMLSFNLPLVDEDLRKNECKHEEALKATFNKKKGNK